MFLDLEDVREELLKKMMIHVVCDLFFLSLNKSSSFSVNERRQTNVTTLLFFLLLLIR